MRKRQNKIDKLSVEAFTKIVASSFTFTECLVRAGLSPNGGTSSKILKRRIAELQLSTEHFKTAANWVPKKALKDILVANSDYGSVRTLKDRLQKELGLGSQCEKCGISPTWNGKALVLQLDHINGISDDHRLENLRFLCPNCHSQTATYAGRNKSRTYKNRRSGSSDRSAVCAYCMSDFQKMPSARPTYCAEGCSAKTKRSFTVTREELHSLVWTEPTSKVAKKFGVSDTAISKRCKALNVTKPPRGYWSKVASGAVTHVVPTLLKL